MRCPSLLSTLILAVSALTLGCPVVEEPDDDDEEMVVQFGVVMGTVQDAFGSGLGDVVVSLGAETTTSNSQGYFLIDDLDDLERAVVSFRKTGYVMTSQVTRVRIGESSYLEAVMAPFAVQQTVSGTTGATVSTPDGGSVTLPPNFAVGPDGSVWTGDVDVAVTVFDPSTDAGLEAFPGEFLGTGLDGGEALLISFAFMDVSLSDPVTGDALGSSSGADFGLTMPVPASMQAEAPATIPLWYFDEEAGRWFEEASASFDGTRYTGSVPHLSIWNCDVAADRSYVIGRVIDCDDGGHPVQGARVTVKGRRGWDSGESSTPSDGTFRIPVDSNHECTIWPAKNGEEGDRIEFISGDTGTTLDVGDLCLGVPRVKVTLTWEAEPRDLDSHITAPGSPRDHLYFGNTNIGDGSLDTDDTDGQGPEVITLFDLRDGTYRYSVHHYSGESDMSSEGATALMIVDGVGIFRQVPPSGASGVNDVWICWDFEASGGSVDSVTRVRSIVESSGSDDLSVFNP